MVSFW